MRKIITIFLVTSFTSSNLTLTPSLFPKQKKYYTFERSQELEDRIPEQQNIITEPIEYEPTARSWVQGMIRRNRNRATRTSRSECRSKAAFACAITVFAGLAFCGACAVRYTMQP